MKVKNKVFVDGTWDALVELGNEKLPFKMSYDVSRIIRKMKDGFTAVSEARNKLIIELGEEDEKTKTFRIKPTSTEAMEKFGEEMKKVSEEEEDYDVKKLTIKAVDLDKDLKIKANVLVVLEDFIEVV